MKYITIQDLTSLIKKNIIDDLSEDNYTLLNSLESLAVSEIDANIGYKFDVDAALTSKHQFLIMILIDLLIYHFESRMSHTGVEQIRQERYDRVQKWLSDVAVGKIAPGLPEKQTPIEYKSTNIYQTNTQMSHVW